MNTIDQAWMDGMVLNEEEKNIDIQNTQNIYNTGKTSVAEKIVLIGMRGVELFHTPDNIAYGAVSLDNGGTAIYPIDSNQMKSLLNQRYYKESRKVPSSEAMKGAVNVLVGRAIHECNEYLLSNRVAWKDGDIVYDMSNAMYETVTISEDGWTISQEKYPMFRRHNHQIPQDTPITGGDVGKLFDIVNVHTADRLMTLVHLVASLVPDIPHAAPNICGEQGSAKSTASKIFKEAAIKQFNKKIANSLNNEDVVVRRYMSAALSEMGSDCYGVADIIIEKLNDSDNMVKVNLISALGKIGPSVQYALPKIIKFLHHRNESVRRNAIVAVSTIGRDLKESPLLIANGLKDESKVVRLQPVSP